MTPPRLSSLLVRVVVGIGSTIGGELPLTDGSGPLDLAGKEHRETLDYEMCLNNYLQIVRTSTRRLPRYWGTTSPGKMTYVSVFAAAGSRLIIAGGRRRTAGSGRPPLAGKGPMLRELETLVSDGGCPCVRRTT